MESIISKYKDYLWALGVSSVTTRSYVSDIRQFLIAKNIKSTKELRFLKERDITEYIKTLSVLKKSLTIKRKSSALRNFTQYLRVTGIIEEEDKRTKSFISLPLDKLLLIAYLFVFTFINAIFLFLNNKVMSPVTEQKIISTIPPNVSTSDAFNLDGVRTNNVFTVSVDDDQNPFGQATITQGENEVTIYNDTISKGSLIFLTPVSPLIEGETLYIKEIHDGSFTVSLNKQQGKDLVFNWFSKTPSIKIY